MKLTREDLAGLIDHTLLRPEATEFQIRSLCAEARAHRLGNVCVNPCWVPVAAAELDATGVGVCSVIDFPLGAGGVDLKRETARLAVAQGAAELDVMIPIGRLRAGDDTGVQEEIAAAVQAAGGRVVKAILETAVLSPLEIDRACEAARQAGAAFVKTSTGFASVGATVEVVRRLRTAVGDRMGVKASGGIRSADQARALLDAGASRLGTSASLAILAGWKDAE